MPASPDKILADALSSLSKAAKLALSTAQHLAKEEVEQARRERDEAVQALHASQSQENEWKRCVETWQASVEKSELTIQHQAETIVQLREEAQQWKNQLLRFEGSSRREAQDWKEQYMRAEQERSKLASKVDELVTEQLAWNTYANSHQNAPITPRSATLPERQDLSASSSSTRRPSTAHSLPPKPITFQSNAMTNVEANSATPRKSKALSSKPQSMRIEAIAKPPTPVRTGATAPARTPRQRTAGGTAPEDIPLPRSPGPIRKMSTITATSVQPRQSVIRRVRAIIEVPVKEEEDDDDDDDILSLLSESSHPPIQQKGPMPGESSQKKAKRRSSTARSKKAKTDWEEDEYEDTEDGEEDRPNSAAQATSKTARSLPRVEYDEDHGEDDELIIGAEDNRSEVYGTQRVIVTSEINAPRRARAAPAAGTSKKRKLDGDATTASRGTSAKAARKK